MKKLCVLAGTLALMSATFVAQAQGDASAGKQKAAACAACHGADGNSATPQFPKLAGQHADYLVKQLKDFKSGARQNPIMAGQVAGLSEQDMQDLAAYFSSQTTGIGAANPATVDKARKLYLGGDMKDHVTACAACHGPSGLGNPPMDIPRLSGQHAAYVVTQLQNFANGSRSNDPKQMMRNIAANMSDAQMKLVADYIQGLHAPQK
ncbi:MAG: c-type cytochrome [Gammaproteobacteria bacterium]|jgi:cytochrome c553